MLLQIAVDVADTARCLAIAEEIHDVIDIFEVGTPVLLREGLAPVRALKAKYPHMTVLADSKIMDGGALEATDLCRAGADLLTVLAVSDDATVRDVVRTAHAYGRRVLADLMCVRDLPARARELTALGADYLCVHTGIDMQKSGRTPLKDLTELVRAVGGARSAVAGGIRPDTVRQYAALDPAIVISGGALCGAPELRSAVLAMKAAMGA